MDIDTTISYAVVLVTYNRLECLKKALNKYEQQTIRPKYIIVINNDSSDGTMEYLQKWQREQQGESEKIVKNLEFNQGGSGGFYEGLKTVSDYDVQWIWIADDDAYPETNAIEQLFDAYKLIDRTEPVSALCSAVVNHGKFDVWHRRRITKSIRGINFVPVEESEYQSQYFEINIASYVGLFVKKEFLLKSGYTRKDFFIYYDDTEHSLRLNKLGKIYCVPSSKVIHDVNRSDFSWKDYYGFRNVLVVLKEYFGASYAYIDAIKRYLLCVAPWNKKYPKEIRRMLFCGLRDGLKARTGLHEVYKPGWNIEKR